LILRFSAAAVIAAAGLAAYSNSFSGPFVFDDVPTVQDNPTLRHLWPVWNTLRPPHGGLGVEGRPLLNLSFAVNYAISGGEVWSYHVFNLAFHLLAGLVLFGVLRRTVEAVKPQAGGLRQVPDALGYAFAVSLLWTVHPLLTESVTFISDRSESLMGLFYLLTLYCFVRGASSEDASREDPRVKSDAPARAVNPWLLLSVLCCLAGMGTKEVMVSAPLMVLLYDRTFVAGGFREAWRRRHWYYAGLAATWMLLGSLVISMGGNRGKVAGFGTSVSWWAYGLTQFRAVALYLRLAFWPHPLVFDYGRGLAAGLGEVAPQAVLVLLLAAGTVVALRRRPILGFLGAWFFAILAPSSSVVPLASQTMAEHRMYLPLIPLLALVVWGLFRWVAPRNAAEVSPASARPRAALAVVLVLAAGLGCMTARRNADYRTDMGLWEATVRDYPVNPLAHYNLARLLALQPGGTPAAIGEYRTALRLDPDLAEAHYNLGYVLAASSDTLQEAVSEYQATLRLEPDNADAHNNLGMALARLPDGTGEAIREFQEALRLQPGLANTHVNLGNALSSIPGRLPEAIGEFEAALRLDPDSIEAHFNLGNALARTPGRRDEAIAQYGEVLRIRPGFGPAQTMIDRLREAQP
jgi:Flp pilus assembly protein TadD